MANGSLIPAMTNLKALLGTDIPNSGTAASNGDTVLNLSTVLGGVDIYNNRTINVEFDGTSIYNGIIVSHTTNTITISTGLDFSVLTEPPASIVVTFTIPKDTAIETSCNSTIATLNASNSAILTSNEFPTNDSKFVQFSNFTDVLIAMSDSWKDQGALNAYITDWNDMTEVDISSTTDSTAINNYFSSITTSITETNTVQSQLLAYFDRLKKLLSKLKITDKKIALEDYLGMYGSKTPSEKSEIDTYYAYYVANGLEAYQAYKVQLLFDEKI